MTGMKLLARLPLNQVSHPPGSPQAAAVTQRLRTFLEAAAEFFQLPGLQPGLAARPVCSLERPGAMFLPGLMPPADRLPVNAQLAGNLGLAEALVKESGGFEPPLFQLIKIAFDAFRITHAQRIAWESTVVTILCDYQ